MQFSLEHRPCIQRKLKKKKERLRLQASNPYIPLHELTVPYHEVLQLFLETFLVLNIVGLITLTDRL